MKRDDEPMTTFDDAEWRTYKRATRNLKYRRRMQSESSRERGRRVLAWLTAIALDDSEDQGYDQLGGVRAIDLDINVEAA